MHDVFRAVSPGFKFDWNGDSGYLQSQTAAYPGDNYVDVVGLDLYDKGMGGATAWNSSTTAWSDPAAAWARILPNLVAQRDFAIAHGKSVSYPEWGLNGVNATATSNVGGDDPTFVQGMYYVDDGAPGVAAPGSLLYQSYFNEDTEDGNHKINSGNFPSASSRYQSLFATSQVTSPTTTTVPPVIQPPATTVPVTAPPSTTTTTIAPVAPVASVPTEPLSTVLGAGAATKNVATETVWPGATRRPYVCCWGSQGQYVTFSFTAPGGPVALHLRYSAGNGSASRKVEIDGAVTTANDAFAGTPSWSSWASGTLSANLTRGTHSMKVWFDQAAGSTNYLNLDTLTVTPALVIPARAAARNVVTESRFAGASSNPYVCCWSSQGQYVTFTFKSVGGPSTLLLRYSAGNGNASRKVELDGVVMNPNQAFPATTDWTTWSAVSLSANLTPATHTVKIWVDQTAGSSNYINLDFLMVRLA